MKKQEGFIGLLILIIIALALLKYFLNWSIFDAMESERGRETVMYMRNVLDLSWTYIKIPVIFVWQLILQLFQK